MLQYVVLFNLLLCPLVICKRKQNKDVTASEELGGKLISKLRDDVNLDLSADEEYEDLRAELLAYHTALATLTAGRRSMKSTPCWKLGGICIDHRMCQGHRFTAQARGCRDKLQVCCFSWNKFQVKDMSDKGLSVGKPWTGRGREFGGLGVIEVPSVQQKKSNKTKIHVDINTESEHDEDFTDSEHVGDPSMSDQRRKMPSMLVVLQPKN